MSLQHLKEVCDRAKLIKAIKKWQSKERKRLKIIRQGLIYKP
jgi:hypothetical protein